MFAIDSRNFGLWRQRTPTFRTDSGGGEGAYQKSFRGGKNTVFSILKSSYFIYVISHLFYRMSLFCNYFCFLKWCCLDYMSKAVMEQWREKVTWPKKGGKLGVSFQIFSILVNLLQLDFEGKSVGLTVMNLSKATIARFFRLHEDGLPLKTASTKMYGRYRTGSF